MNRDEIGLKTRVLQPPRKFENFIVATSTSANVGGFVQKYPFDQFRKNLSMFRGLAVTSKFWQFQNNFFSCAISRICDHF